MGTPYPGFGTGEASMKPAIPTSQQVLAELSTTCQNKFTQKDIAFRAINVTGSESPDRASYNGAHKAIRTPDLFLTKEVLYLLSYMSLKSSSPCHLSNKFWSGWRESNPLHQLGRLR
jgi:hypothetical protein